MNLNPISGMLSYDKETRRLLLEDQDDSVPITAGQILGGHKKQSEIALFGRIYRLKDISKCGGGRDSPRFCVDIHLGQPITLPKTIQLSMSKMCKINIIHSVSKYS